MSGVEIDAHTAEVRFDWGGEKRVFRLGLGEIRKLETARDAGLFELLQRLIAGRWRFDDVRDTLLFGLIGGGLREAAAAKLVDRELRPGHMLAHVTPAKAVLMAALMEVPDDPLKKAEAAKVQDPGSFPSPLSTAPAPSSASLPPRSMQ